MSKPDTQTRPPARLLREAKQLGITSDRRRRVKQLAVETAQPINYGTDMRERARKLIEWLDLLALRRPDATVKQIRETLVKEFGL